MALSDKQRELLKAVLREKGLAAAGPARSIERRASTDPAPATHLQEGLWMLEQLDQQHGIYNVPSAVRFAGPVDVPTLERTLDEILRRHDALRTMFVSNGTVVQQLVKPHSPFKLDVVDLCDLTGPAGEARARELVMQDAGRPFKLDSEIPFRAFMIRLSEGEHILALNIHHIVTDGYSMGVLTNELVSLYGAFSQGRPSSLPDLPIQFADYAAWHREYLTGQELERQGNFWRNTLQRPLPTLELPADRPRPPRLSGRGLHEHIHIPRDLTSRLRSFSQGHGVTVFETLLAGFAVLLHSYSGQDDIIVGSPVANRTRTELENLIGYFVNVLPFRVDLRGNPSFQELAKRVHQVSHGVHSHQEMAFGKIVEWVQPPRDSSRNPIYQVELTLLEPRNTPSVYGYGFQTIAERSLRLGGAVASPFPMESGVSKFDLTMLLWNFPDEIQGTIEYSTDLFEARTISAMAKRFVSLLHGALAGRELKISDLCHRNEPPSPERKVGAVRRRAIRIPQ